MTLPELLRCASAALQETEPEMAKELYYAAFRLTEALALGDALSILTEVGIPQGVPK